MHGRLSVLLMAAFVIFAVSACGGGGGEEAKARIIPENKAGEIPAGRYVSDEFEPAMSFSLGAGWQVPEPGGWLETPTNLSVTGASPLEDYWLEFLTVPEVYEVVSSYDAKAQPAPKNMVAWLQQNPYLDTEKPRQVTIGGEKGKQLDAVPSRIPQDYYGAGCPEPCLPLFEVVAGDEESTYELFKDDRVRFIVLEDVKGKVVTIGILGPAKRFDEFLPKAHKVFDTVEWEGK
jgi:hypothetical protein